MTLFPRYSQLSVIIFCTARRASYRTVESSCWGVEGGLQGRCETTVGSETRRRGDEATRRSEEARAATRDGRTHLHQLHHVLLGAELVQRLAAVRVVCHVLAAVVDRNGDALCGNGGTEVRAGEGHGRRAVTEQATTATATTTTMLGVLVLPGEIEASWAESRGGEPMLCRQTSGAGGTVDNQKPVELCHAQGRGEMGRKRRKGGEERGGDTDKAKKRGTKEKGTKEQARTPAKAHNTSKPGNSTGTARRLTVTSSDFVR